MFDGPEGAEHHHHTGHRWIDYVLAGSALLISVISLTVAILHGRTMEQMADANARLVEANSWPFLTLILSMEPEKLSFGVRNNGVGPAKVHWVEVSMDGKPVRSMYELINETIKSTGVPLGASEHLSYDYSVVDGAVIRAGDVTIVSSLSAKETRPEVFAAMRKRFLKLSVRTCYCSVFDDCFISDGQSLDPKPVKVCPTAHVPFDPTPSSTR